MSTITVTNIKATGETASRSATSIAAAWASVKADNSGFNDSLNCSSLADNGTGDGTPSFTNAMANANYAHNLGHRAGSLTSGSSNQRNVYVVSVAAGNINLKNSYTTTNGALIFFDMNHTFSINGDLA